MIEKTIAFALRYRYLVLIAALFSIFASIWAMRNTPLDALPDLSPPQVIVQIKWRGQSPDIVESQVTYPLVSQFLAISDIETVRGFSSYENGLIYILFKENVDIYEARNRVSEQIAAIRNTLPSDAEITMGPDASGVGWAFEYALVSKHKDLAALRTYQDYYLKYALLGIDGVSEVATIGGFVPTYQVTIDNDALLRYNLSVEDVARTLRDNNDASGGSILTHSGFEWMISANGYLKSLDEIAALVVTEKDGVPVTIGQLGRVERVPAPRRGVADLDGKGETVGGIVVVKYGADVYSVIKRIKHTLASMRTDDIDIVTTYDRSDLIEKAIDTLRHTLIEESLVVLIVIGLFLFHFRSSLIVLIVLPLTVGLTFLAMKLFGIGSNIMSLGGIAIAIGAMVDATIVMIENVHKTLMHTATDDPHPDARTRLALVRQASQKLGRPVFFALALVVVSFLPIFALQGQEGLLFTPLAYTKTFAMSAGALLAVTLVPVLMYYFVRGKIPDERRNPLNRFFIALYRPILVWGLRLRYLFLAIAIALLLAAIPIYRSLKWEFMPMLDEQSIMYMPVTPYGISIDQSKAITQKTDAILKSFPEVARVFGKGGRADTATDPAPLSMIETIVTLKPRSQWRKGMSTRKLIDEMDKALRFPGLVNTWTYPIRGRIDMLLSGIRTPLGIKLYGNDAKRLQKLAKRIEKRLASLPQSASVVADRAMDGYYLHIDIDTDALQRYGITKKYLLHVVSIALGGERITVKYEGLARYPVTIRLEERQRNSLEKIAELPIKTPKGYVPLKTFARLAYTHGASVIKSELATPVSYIYITPTSGVSSVAYKKIAQEALRTIRLPEGYRMEWAGQSQYLESAMQRIVWIVPAVLLLIAILIYFALKEPIPALIVFFTLPFALLGGVFYLYLLDFSMSVAVIVGFLALMGIAAETAIVMIVYLKESIARAKARYGNRFDENSLREAIYEGAVERLRPKLMTVFAILAGLLPIMYTQGVGSEVMRRIAAPMIGGIVSSAVLSLIVIPILYMIYEKKSLRRRAS